MKFANTKKNMHQLKKNTLQIAYSAWNHNLITCAASKWNQHVFSLIAWEKKFTFLGFANLLMCFTFFFFSYSCMSASHKTGWTCWNFFQLLLYETSQHLLTFSNLHLLPRIADWTRGTEDRLIMNECKLMTIFFFSWEIKIMWPHLQHFWVALKRLVETQRMLMYDARVK